MGPQILDLHFKGYSIAKIARKLKIEMKEVVRVIYDDIDAKPAQSSNNNSTY